MRCVQAVKGERRNAVILGKLVILASRSSIAAKRGWKIDAGGSEFQGRKLLELIPRKTALSTVRGERTLAPFAAVTGVVT
jgi:hypothetical protein